MAREGQITVHSENMFPIIKKWLYSDKDIFLRELVANACDAISKRQRLESLGEAPQGGETPRIIIRTDAEAKTLTIEDNGIGMTGDEVEKYIAQVAFSGAEDFLKQYESQGEEGQNGIIGHFGLGFYSAFMVADTVDIDTLSCQPGAQAVTWSSSGVSTYTMDDSGRTQVGSLITLHLAEAEGEFLEEHRIREILRKYCAFMPYEIYLNPTDVWEEPEQAEEEEGKEPPRKNYPVNDTAPLWKKTPKDCTDEEYKQFYMQNFMDFNEPLFWIHLNVDYPFRLQGILYFPKNQNKLELVPGQVKLYCNQVYVADNIKEVIPEFLLLLKGVIDCPDLPLNVSRSFLQNDGDVAKISAHITKKVSDKLHAIFKSERERYEGCWEDLAPFIKFGCIKDEKFYDRIQDILLFKTTAGKFYTLEEYPKEEGKIFYASDVDKQSQYIRLSEEMGQPVAVLDHMIDNHFVSFLEYKDSNLHFGRVDSDLSGALKEKDETVVDVALADAFKAHIGEEKLNIRTEELKNGQIPAVFLLGESERRMQEMAQMYGETMGFGGETERTIVLNTKNPLVKALPTLTGQVQEMACRQIYDLALLSHKTLSAQEMSDFVARSVSLLCKAAGIEEKE
ncbi:MAG: molecular chaperone HtpG [Oscillospiraceae bacterium]|nr:molecular chaperone HtpG [Oscillospiraceae bacterium]